MDGEIADLRAELRRLQEENARLTALLRLSPSEAGPPGPTQTGGLGSPNGPISRTSPPTAKVAFFADLFAARRDVYAVRWESTRTAKSGWMPAVAGGWRRGRDPRSATYLPLTAEVITSHLAGDIDLGLYPLMSDDTCPWLAADFDGAASMLDALAYLKAARAHGVPAALEVSRSGVGAHVWTFFTAPVPAAAARRLGVGLLREAMTIRGRMTLSSYDRLFPSQDVLPSGGFGNLIAAPLQGRCRRLGTTVFLDLATMEPHEDQWAYLSSLDRMTPRELARAVARVGEPVVGVGVHGATSTKATRIQVPAPPVVHVTLSSRVTVSASDLTPAMASTLMHAASLRNPAFDERQRLRRSTWDTPRYLRFYDETLTGDLVVPRGLFPLVESLVAGQGSRLELTDARVDGQPVELELDATLRPDQSRALEAVTGHDLGVLVAPPGAGKTVIAIAAMARTGRSTLVLVDRKTLADQWRTQITTLLGIKAGQLGGGRTKRTGVIDVAMLQTLARRDDIADVTAGYGLVIVDECHHVPAAAFEDVVKQIPARRWLGLTATPYRRDRLDDLIALQLGPVRHTITTEATAAGQLPVADGEPGPERRLVLHHTTYRYGGDADPFAPGGIAAVYRDLVADDDRLTLVVDDIVEALARGRHCLVLTQWTAHVERFTTALTQRGHETVVLVGGMGARARAAANARLRRSNPPPVAGQGDRRGARLRRCGRPDTRVITGQAGQGLPQPGLPRPPGHGAAQRLDLSRMCARCAQSLPGSSGHQRTRADENSLRSNGKGPNP